jgi:predicted HicB family RNase H-like nuclease
MTKRETLNLRVSSAFKRKLTEEAKKENRSVTNYLETTLEALWQERGKASSPKGKGSSG